MSSNVSESSTSVQFERFSKESCVRQVLEMCGFQRLLPFRECQHRRGHRVAMRKGFLHPPPSSPTRGTNFDHMTSQTTESRTQMPTRLKKILRKSSVPKNTSTMTHSSEVPHFVVLRLSFAALSTTCCSVGCNHQCKVGL